MAVGEINEASDYRSLSAQALGEINKGNRAVARRNICDDSVIEKYREAK